MGLGLPRVRAVPRCALEHSLAWSALDRALRSSSDVTLERDSEGHPWTRGDLAVTAMLNEVSHHGTQICMVRDLFAHR